MEKMVFTYPCGKRVSSRAHIGVAGSGDLEILMEPSWDDCAHVVVRTSVEGLSEVWKAVLDKFFAIHDLVVTLEINDFGATPGVVSLRLEQAAEVLKDAESSIRG